jgi:16S rRNA (uracil1498-N3)-methyltransferase
VREASKQSLRSWIPDVLDLVTTKQLAQLTAGVRMLVLEPTAPIALSEFTLDLADLMIVVGPEGGISPHELEMLVEAGAELVRLGPEVLRTSTAGPAALAVINSMLGRW